MRMAAKDSSGEDDTRGTAQELRYANGKVAVVLQADGSGFC